MFPYPSGQASRGTSFGYILMCMQDIKDIKVLMYCPMGYDSFGLPAEQYAIQTGQRQKIRLVNIDGGLIRRK
jgi:leucyl-tRNA synthetase